MASISSLPKRGQTHGDVNRKLSGFDTVERIAQPMADSSEHLSKRLLLSSEDVHCDPEFPISQQRLANMCFFLIGIGVAIGWTVCRSGISYFAMKFPIGWTFYSYATAAYNFPALPVLLCQTLYDGKVDDMYGSSRTYTVRLVFAFVAMTASLATVPLGTQTSTLVSIALVSPVCRLTVDVVQRNCFSHRASLVHTSTAPMSLLCLHIGTLTQPGTELSLRPHKVYSCRCTVGYRLVGRFIILTCVFHCWPQMYRDMQVGVFDSVAYGTASQFFSMFSASTGEVFTCTPLAFSARVQLSFLRDFAVLHSIP